jgi:hypothetical protein
MVKPKQSTGRPAGVELAGRSFFGDRNDIQGLDAPPGTFCCDFCSNRPKRFQVESAAGGVTGDVPRRALLIEQTSES